MSEVSTPQRQAGKRTAVPRIAGSAARVCFSMICPTCMCAYTHTPAYAHKTSHTHTHIHIYVFIQRLRTYTLLSKNM